MIQFDCVSKQYPGGYRALNNVSFQLEKGSMTFVTGHSGAGKSTLLKLLIKTEEATQGQVLVNGQNLHRMSRAAINHYRSTMGLIFQNPTLIDHRTVFENIALPLYIAGMSKQDIAPRVRAALNKVGLLDKERYYPFHLSIGEQQRIGIARAVVNRPTLLLADEPTGNLDPTLAAEIMHLFEQFNQIGTTVLIVSHDLHLISQMRYPILSLKNGTLVRNLPYA